MSVIYKNEEFNSITKDNLLTLDLSGKGIKSITEIENLGTLTELQVLKLSNNQIDEIVGLDNLTKLRKLDLSNNKITEIDGLKNLINLKELNLENNKFIDIKGLENLINLEKLFLGIRMVSVDSDGKPKTKGAKFAHGVGEVLSFIGGVWGDFTYKKKALLLNRKELVGVEKKIAHSDVKNIVAYCRVKLKQSGYAKGLIPADSGLEKLEEKIVKMLKKYDRMIKRAIKEQERVKRKIDYSQMPRS